MSNINDAKRFDGELSSNLRKHDMDCTISECTNLNCGDLVKIKANTINFPYEFFNVLAIQEQFIKDALTHTVRHSHDCPVVDCIGCCPEIVPDKIVRKFFVATGKECT